MRQNNSIKWPRPIPYPIPNPHQLTANALRLAEGKLTNALTDADIDSYLDYAERKEITDRVIEKHFKP